MLYDPKWEVQAKPDVLSFESLIAWLETMPADKAYEYDNCRGGCLYGLYMAHHNIEWEKSGACGTDDSGPARTGFCERVYATVAARRPWTFGAALKRARAALA